MDNTQQQDGKDTPRQNAAASPVLSEKQRRELWMYIAVSIVAVEMLVAVGAVLYGFISAPPGAAGGNAFTFPWLSWGAMALLAPTLILLLVHVADVGLFRAPGGASSEQEWQRLLPGRLQKLYRIIKGAPVVVVLVGIVLFGAALLTLDGALTAIKQFGAALAPYIPHIVGGAALVLCVVIIAIAWLNFRTRKLIAEYEFRKEVLEKTGVIIVDKGSSALPPGGLGDVPYTLVSGESPARALPPGDSRPDDSRPGDSNETFDSPADQDPQERGKL